MEVQVTKTVKTPFQNHNTVTLVWVTKKGEPDYMEDLVYESQGYTDLQELEEKGLQYCKENGCDRMRISVIDLNQKPDFTKTFN